MISIFTHQNGVHTMRTQLSKLTLTAGIVLAMAFTFSCDNGGNDDPGTSSPGGADNSSSSGGINSGGGSSPSGSSSSSANIFVGDKGTFEDNRDGQIYKWVKIGEQIWMAENLNYDVPANDTDVCYDYYLANCTEYGRLYSYATAMDLHSSCNTSTCAEQVNPKHQGICPADWHIPSNADWDKLIRSVDGNTDTSSPYESPTAGRYLKSRDGWSNGGNGEDTFGFAALPGGYRYSNGNFQEVGDFGDWWSASEIASSSAYSRNMSYRYENVPYNDHDNKSALLSIRCVKN